MLATVRNGLVSALDPKVVDELLEAYQQAKRNYYLGGLRLSAVEGGRFCEAAFRILQQRTRGSFDALGKTLDTDALIRQLANLPATQEPEAVRLHIPRALRVVYDIRNKRDNAHLGDGIDPNLQDATLVVSILDWILAELVRLYHTVSANKAHQIVAGIVTRSAPAIEEFGAFLKVLRADLRATDFVLLLLYQRGLQGATYSELEEWVRPKMRANLRRTLHSLEHDKAFAHRDADHFKITRTGLAHVEENGLADAAK